MKLSLPILPTPATECARFVCSRRHVDLTVGQCAGRYQIRDDDACARDAHGELALEGCPTGAAAVEALEGLYARMAKIRIPRSRRAA